MSYHADLLRDRHARKGTYDTTTDGALIDLLPFEALI